MLRLNPSRNFACHCLTEYIRGACIIQFEKKSLKKTAAALTTTCFYFSKLLHWPHRLVDTVLYTMYINIMFIDSHYKLLRLLAT